MITPLKPLKWYHNLADKKGRQEAGAFLVEGDRAISQIMSTKPDEIIEILTTDDPIPVINDYPVRQILASQLIYISNTKTPQGTLALVRQPKDIYSNSLPEELGDRILFLEDIQDPGNVGTLIRTASAFGFSGIVMSEKCADPLSPKCVQSSAGSLLSIWMRRTVGYLQLTRAFKNAGYFLVEADVHGETDPAIFGTQSKLVLALGNEGAGLSKGLLEMADYLLRIPIDSDKAESLNVAVCGAICMYLSSQKSG